MYSFGGGIMFEPEHSKISESGVDGGVAWLLYRQRSRSAGEISLTTNSDELAGVSDLRHTGAPSGQSDVRSSASRQSALFNKLAALIKGSSAHSPTASLDKSENHSSACKKRFSFGNNNPNPILAISTSSLAFAASSTREMDGVQSMHFFNLQHHAVMSAGSPTSTVSTSSHLPPLSTTATNVSTYSAESHSSTCTTCSYASTASDSTAYTTTSSAASTLCHHHHTSSQRKERSRRIGMRKFFRWTRNLRGETGTATGVGVSSRSKTDMFSTTTSSSTGPRGANSAFFQPREGPSLKELSGRQTRYYDKRGMQAASTGGAPSGRDRRGAKRVDAKALFSNERTFMHWIKFGLLLGTMALNLTSFGHSVGLKVGLFLVVVAMATLVYSTTIFHVRHGWMAKMRQDVLFYDRIGPSVLFAALFFAYATNVALTMRKMFGDFTEESGETYFNMNKGPLDI
ncbi:hypothetical protein BG006_001440 [Podila minutissima]|uniref:DUF202 domain-containing protein n=1 Tax=Podila minutissima TaxID=64525 RepID=A0A9P5SE28_9FUNG|nr:hypothetical protein BG006_001440 [Podila minutissima]